MAQMLGKLCKAVRSVGVPDDQAREAADHHNCFARISADLRVLKWLTGTTLAGVLALVIRAFTA